PRLGTRPPPPPALPNPRRQSRARISPASSKCRRVTRAAPPRPSWKNTCAGRAPDVRFSHFRTTPAASPPAVELVCPLSTRPALAPQSRSVLDLGQRNHASADPGVYGDSLFRGLSGGFPDHR